MAWIVRRLTGWTGTHSASHNRCRERDVFIRCGICEVRLRNQRRKLKRLPPDDENAERIQEQSLWPGWKNSYVLLAWISATFVILLHSESTTLPHGLEQTNMHLRLQVV